mmetsp:Transcript_18921/g.29240  ORF Transcript_18921/g.29240 Transcript_18921/m.29240 type:complete len:104 (-) Transcript_18921:372-683(-)
MYPNLLDVILDVFCIYQNQKSLNAFYRDTIFCVNEAAIWEAKLDSSNSKTSQQAYKHGLEALMAELFMPAANLVDLKSCVLAYSVVQMWELLSHQLLSIKHTN